MEAWQLIFQQSRVNNGIYMGDGLAIQNWRWPRDTWFQKRLGYIRKVTARTELSPYDGRILRLPHGMCTTHKDQINAELLAFIKKE